MERATILAEPKQEETAELLRTLIGSNKDLKNAPRILWEYLENWNITGYQQARIFRTVEVMRDTLNDILLLE